MKFVALLGYGVIIALIVAGLWLVIDRVIKAEAANRALADKSDK